MWRTLEFDFGGTNTVLVKLTDGAQVIEVLTGVELVGRTAVLRGLHIPVAVATHLDRRL